MDHADEEALHEGEIPAEVVDYGHYFVTDEVKYNFI